MAVHGVIFVEVPQQVGGGRGHIQLTVGMLLQLHRGVLILEHRAHGEGTLVEAATEVTFAVGAPANEILAAQRVDVVRVHIHGDGGAGAVDGGDADPRAAR